MRREDNKQLAGQVSDCSTSDNKQYVYVPFYLSGMAELRKSDIFIVDILPTLSGRVSSKVTNALHCNGYYYHVSVVITINVPNT